MKIKIPHRSKSPSSSNNKNFSNTNNNTNHTHSTGTPIFHKNLAESSTLNALVLLPAEQRSRLRRSHSFASTSYESLSGRSSRMSDAGDNNFDNSSRAITTSVSKQDNNSNSDDDDDQNDTTGESSSFESNNTKRNNTTNHVSSSLQQQISLATTTSGEESNASFIHGGGESSIGSKSFNASRSHNASQYLFGDSNANAFMASVSPGMNYLEQSGNILGKSQSTKRSPKRALALVQRFRTTHKENMQARKQIQENQRSSLSNLNSTQ